MAKSLPEFDSRIGRYGAGPGEVTPDVKNPIAGYAAMMENFDNQIGELFTLLHDLGADENTLILFTSDNGCHREGGHDPNFWDSNGPLRGIKRDLITGPNMGGKSTYMRQNALIVLLAHCGAFVPAVKVTLSLVDRIFTRIGSSDDLASGLSTFLFLLF